MPDLSERSGLMPNSPIRKLVPLADAAKKRGVKILHLNIGQPDIETPETALRAIRNFDETHVAYSHSAGLRTYREALCRYYKPLHIDLNPDEIIVTTGGSEALQMAFMCTLECGDELIIPEPFYANYNGFSALGEVHIKPVTSSIEEGFALPPIERISALISKKTKGILINNPSNPTGYVYHLEELEQLRELVVKHDLWLYADEVYREFCYDGAVHHSAMCLKGIEDHVILIDSASKRYSLCGARIGLLASHNETFMRAAMRFAQARLSPPTFGQIAGMAALEMPESYLNDVIAEYDQRRRTMVAGLRKLPGVICPEPSGAFYCVAALPVDDAESFCSWMLTDFQHNGHTVMLAPASGFYSTPGIGKNQIRIAYVLKQEDLEQALDVLGAALTEYRMAARL